MKVAENVINYIYITLFPQMFDGQRTYYTDQQLIAQGDDQNRQQFMSENQIPYDQAELTFIHFVTQWNQNNIYIYR